MTTAYLNRIATAVPEHDVHDTFVVFAEKMLADPRLRTVFRRMVSRADIAHRYSFLDPQKGSGQFSPHNANEFYRLGKFPNTARRMELFEQSAPVLMRKAVDRLALSEEERSGITHVLVTCCTGLYAPGLDFEIVDHLGLSADVERTMVGFMGCYAAICGRWVGSTQDQSSSALANMLLAKYAFLDIYCGINIGHRYYRGFLQSQNSRDVLSYISWSTRVWWSAKPINDKIITSF